MRFWIGVVCCSIVCGLSPAGSLASAEAERDKRALVRIWMETVNSPRTLAYMVALSGASREATKSVYLDFSKRVSGQKAPQVRVVGDDVELNGRKSGLKILAYDPLKLAYQGKVWSASSGQAADKVYFELVKLFSDARKTVRWRPWSFSEAWAGDAASTLLGAGVGAGGGAFSGAIVGSFAGWLAGLGAGGWAGWEVAKRLIVPALKLGARAAGPVGIGAGLAVSALFAYFASQGGAAIGGLAGFAIGGAVGGTAGGVAGAVSGTSGDDFMADAMFAASAKDCGNIRASCTDGFASVEGNGAVITARKGKAGAKNALEIKIDGKPLDLAKADPGRVEEISGLLLQCTSKEQQPLTERASNACRLAAEVMSGDGGVTKNGSAAGKIE